MRDIKVRLKRAAPNVVGARRAVPLLTVPILARPRVMPRPVGDAGIEHRRRPCLGQATEERRVLC